MQRIPGGRAIEIHDLPSILKVALDEIRADKPGSSGYENTSHGFLSLFWNAGQCVLSQVSTSRPGVPRFTGTITRSGGQGTSRYRDSLACPTIRPHHGFA